MLVLFDVTSGFTNNSSDAAIANKLPSKDASKASSSVPDFYDYSAEMRASKDSNNSQPKEPSKPTTVVTSKPSNNTRKGPLSVPNKRLASPATSTRPISSSSPRRSVRSQPIEQIPPSTTLNEYENQIMTEMLDASPGIKWSDIAGLAYAKQTLQEVLLMCK